MISCPILALVWARQCTSWRNLVLVLLTNAAGIRVIDKITRSIWKMLGPFATASRRTLPVLHCHSPGVATVTRHHCRTPPAHRCPQQQRQRVTEGTAMAPWNGPSKLHLWLCVCYCLCVCTVKGKRLELPITKVGTDVIMAVASLARKWGQEVKDQDYTVLKNVMVARLRVKWRRCCCCWHGLIPCQKFSGDSSK